MSNDNPLARKHCAPCEGHVAPLPRHLAAALAGHHPDLHLVSYRQAAIELWTHAAGGLTENDFILAAKIDELPVELKK
jgi:hypothetical protein